MVKQFNRLNVSEFDLSLISLLGYEVILKDIHGSVLIVGTFHTHIANPMKYFSVTNSLSQHVMSYHEIFSIDAKTFVVKLAY